ncbi:serine/threonine-protein kinase [Spirillospora sp. CA-294931]|uniref:serine/threonine-protein kinase n=1 Tax=Spirillospora sp. CA-294931 TaxID=3240042 RepID=UPI003D8A5C16
MTDPAPLAPGDPRRLGAYELTGRLGEGGQGVVYLGRGLAGRPVAVKLLHARFDRDAEARARFVRELSVIERVAGFCTAQVLESDVDGDRPYIVSEYVAGPSLHYLVKETGPRSGTDLDRLAIGTATALTAIHRAGVVHRDFKPPNVLMGPDGPRVIDFGIARALDGRATASSGVVGTPAYMAPEQVSGAPVDTPVDIFAWGTTIVFAATGRAPYGHDTIPAVFNRILHHQPDLTGLPPHLRAVVAACLRKDPAHRPTAQQLLLRLLGEEGPQGALVQGATMAQQGWATTIPQAPIIHAPLPPPMPPPTLPPPRPRTGLKVLAAGAALILMAGGGVAAWTLTRDEKPKKSVATDVLDPPEEARRHAAAATHLRDVLDYDNRTMDADVQRANSRMTQRAQARYTANLTSIRDDLRRRQGAIKSTIIDTGVLASSPGRVSLLSFVRRVTTSSSKPVTTLDQIRYTLVHQNGTWLIDELDALEPRLQPWTYDTAWPGQAAQTPLNAARECARRLQTYDYRRAEADVNELLDCSTGEYYNTVSSNKAKNVAAMVKQQSVATGTPLEAALKPGAQPARATIMISVAVNVTGDKNGKTGKVVYGYWADMKQINGHWKLAKLDWIQ